MAKAALSRTLSAMGPFCVTEVNPVLAASVEVLQDALKFSRCRNFMCQPRRNSTLASALLNLVCSPSLAKIDHRKAGQLSNHMADLHVFSSRAIRSVCRDVSPC